MFVSRSSIVNSPPGTRITYSVPWSDDPLLKAAGTRLLASMIKAAGGGGDLTGQSDVNGG